MSNFSVGLKSGIVSVLVGFAGVGAACTSSTPSPGTGDGGSSGAMSSAGTMSQSGAATTGGKNGSGGAGGGCLGKQCDPGGGSDAVGGEGGSESGGTEAASGSSMGGSAGSGGTAGSAGSGGQSCGAPASFVDLAQLVDGPRSVEAEVGTLSGAAIVASNGTGFTGTGFVDFAGTEGAVEWAVSVPNTADYLLSWTSCAGQERPMVLEIACVADGDPLVFAETGGWESAWQTTTKRSAHLVKGVNRIRLRTNGSSGPNIDKITLAPPSCELKSDANVVCEAEDAIQTGTAGVAMDGGGWTGSGFSDMHGAEGGIAWSFDAPEAGKYLLTFSYVQDDVRDMTAILNGTTVAASLQFNNTHTWNNGWKADVTLEVNLVEGLNSFRLITNGGSGPNFDNVSVKLVPDIGAGGAGGVGGASGI